MVIWVHVSTILNGWPSNKRRKSGVKKLPKQVIIVTMRDAMLGTGKLFRFKSELTGYQDGILF